MNDTPTITIRDGALVCPRCGGNNLHQVVVEALERPRERLTGTVVRVHGTRASFRAVAQLEHEADEGRIRISFWCEDCCGDCISRDPDDGRCDEQCRQLLVLELLQHKGVTLVSFKEAPPAEAKET